jgi:hypothetical protein
MAQAAVMWLFILDLRVKGTEMVSNGRQQAAES